MRSIKQFFSLTKNEILASLFLLCLVGLLYFLKIYAAGTSLTQTILGVMDLSIVDENGNPILNPKITFPDFKYSESPQELVSIKGSAQLKFRIVNPTGSEIWAFNIAAVDGTKAIWSDSTSNFDYNDPSSSATDSSDGDSVGGRLTIDLDDMRVEGIGKTTLDAIIIGETVSFEEQVTDSIDILRAYPGSNPCGGWEISGQSFRQLIPAKQTPGNYNLDLVLTFI